VVGSNDHWMLSLVVVSAVRNVAIWWLVDSIHFTTKSDSEMQFGEDSGLEIDFNEDSDKMPKKKSFKRKSNASSGKMRFMEDKDDSHSSYDDAKESDSNDTYVY
jgi:hypothetical protein